MGRIRDNKRAFFCLIVVAFAYFWTNFHRQSMAVLAPYFMKEMGVTTAQVGTLGSIIFYMYGITQIPFGIIADKYGSKKIIQFCLFALVIGTYIFGHAENYSQLLIGRLIIGFAISGFFVPSLSLIRGWFDIRVYSTFLGVFMGIGNTGSVLATTPFEFLISNFSLTSIYTAFGIIVLILAVASLFLYEEPLHLLKKESQGKKEKAFMPFYYFLAATCLMGLIYNGARQGFQSLWGTSYYIEVFHLDVRRASFLMMIFSIGGIVFAPVAGGIADKYGRFNALIILALASVVTWVGVGFTPENSSFIVIATLAFILGALNNSTMQNAFTALGDYARPEQRSLISAILNTLSFFGSATFTQSLGIIFESVEMNHSTFLMVFTAFAAMILVASIIVVFVKRNLDRELELRATTNV